MVFNPTTMEVTVGCCAKGWEGFEPDAQEEIPPARSEAQGNVESQYLFGMHQLFVFKEAKYSGKQLFGPGFIALTIARELIVALRYKLQSFEVPIVGVDGELDGPALVCCDYQGIIATQAVQS